MTEAEQDIRFIQARIQVAEEYLKNGRKQKAVDVLEDLILSFPKHSLIPEVKRLLEAAKKP
jgi:Tfp pilus assembly protein PilF